MRFVSDVEPTKEDLINFMGDNSKRYIELEKLFLQLNPNIKVILHNTGKGGWTFKYYIKRKYIAQIKVMDDSFELMCRFDEKASQEILNIENKFVGYGKAAWANRYPCSTGFWIHLKVSNDNDLNDALLVTPILVNSKK